MTYYTNVSLNEKEHKDLVEVAEDLKGSRSQVLRLAFKKFLEERNK